jgi:multiple sugar transport system ATP-binding protein
MLAGLEDPSEGLISIDGKVVNEVPPGARDIAMVFQSYALYPHMTVRENIGFGLSVRGMNKQEIGKRVDEAAKVLEISDLLDRRPRQLSGGQRQRVALGRALTRDPKAFLLDEPLSNLDAQLRTQMRAELKMLFERVRGTVVYVTHDQAEAMTLSDRLAVMRGGFLQQLGTPLEVYNKPSNVFVAKFLGSPSMNFISCDLRVNAGVGTLSAPGFNYNVDDALRALGERATGGKTILGIRPEDIRVSRQASNGSGLACRVDLLEPMGSLNIIYANTGHDRIVATVEPSFFVSPGETVWLHLDDTKVHLFDRETETNLAVQA